MKKWIIKLVFSLIVISISCLYSGGAMAMHMDSDDSQFCDHCYTQKALNCELSTVVMPNHDDDNDFDQNHTPNHHFHFHLPTEDLHPSTPHHHNWRPEKDKIPAPPFTTNKVVILI